MRTHIWLIILSAAFITPMTAAQSGVACTARAVMARYETLGSSSIIAAHGTTAYVQSSNRGLDIVDISEPTNPTLLTTWPAPLRLRSLTNDGSTVFLSVLNTGIVVIDASDPSNPSELTTIPITGYVRDLAITNNTLYALELNTLRITDISNINNPQILSSLPMELFIRRINVVGSTLYITAYASGLYIVDASNPANPFIVHQQRELGRVNDIAIRDNFAFITDETFGLRVLDISTPINPVEIAQIRTPGGAQGIILDHNTLYIADGEAGINAIDITNPHHPTALGMMGFMRGYYDNLTIANNTILTTTQINGLELIAPQQYNQPIRSTTQTSGQPTRSTKAGDLFYIANGDQGLAIYDVLDTNNPVSRSQTPTPSLALDVAVQASTAFVIDADTGLLIYDTTNPQAPDLLSTTALPGTARAIALQNNTACIASSQGLQLIDITEPATPSVLGFISLPNAYHLTLGDGVAYVACDDQGLHVIDISDPLHPIALGSYDENNYNARNVVADGTTLFVSNYNNKNNGSLGFIDASDPANPTVIETTGYGEDGAFFANNHLYTIQFDSFTILDPYFPYEPRLLGHLPLFDRASHIHIEGSTAYILSRDAGTLTIVDLSDCSCPGDHNHDDSITPADIPAFLNAFNAQQSYADLNSDNAFNFFDISTFIESYLSGCK